MSYSERDESDAGQTERVSADLLATSVSKSVLAKEVLRLKQVALSLQHATRPHAHADDVLVHRARAQLRDELVQSTSDSPSALAARCQQLSREIREEEELAARETAELAEQVGTRRTAFLVVPPKSLPSLH